MTWVASAVHGARPPYHRGWLLHGACWAILPFPDARTVSRRMFTKTLGLLWQRDEGRSGFTCPSRLAWPSGLLGFRRRGSNAMKFLWSFEAVFRRYATTLLMFRFCPEKVNLPCFLA